MFDCLISSLTKKGSATYNYFPLKKNDGLSCQLNSDTLHAERFEHSWKAKELSTLMDIVCSEARSMVKLRQRRLLSEQKINNSHQIGKLCYCASLHSSEKALLHKFLFIDLRCCALCHCFLFEKIQGG